MATRTDILKYTCLPGILPRIMAFFRSGFIHMAYMMAIVYRNVRLLPPDHPYLVPENMGRYGIRHVIGEAANNLIFSRKNIDQIVIFFTILAGLILLVVQFALLVVALMAENPAFAIGILNVTDLFNNPNANTGSAGRTQDIAFILLDRVFGVEGYFDSCISTAVACTDVNGNAVVTIPAGNYPFPFHDALHNMLMFYSYGIFLVSVFVIIYFVITTISETAQTGTPFGQRFNRAWVPIRIIIFFALLIPLNPAGTPNDGFNAAQLITFKIVQMGSDFATNGWAFFNGGGNAAASPSANYMSQQYDIVAAPKIPEVNNLLQFMSVAHACKQAYGMEDGTEIDAYLVRPKPIPGSGAGGPDASALNTTGFVAAQNFVSGGTISIAFGELGASEEFDVYKGRVKPYCGELNLPIPAQTEPGAMSITERYYAVIWSIWNDNDFRNRAIGEVRRHMSKNQDPNYVPYFADGTGWEEGEIAAYTAVVRAAVQVGIAQQRANGDFNMPPGLIERGWAGAAIWYNRIAAMNGAITTATLNIPKPSKIPILMELVVREGKKQNDNVDFETLFDQKQAETIGINVLADMKKIDREKVTVMNQAYKFWVESGGAQTTNFDQPTGNIIIDFINAVLGTSGLFEMRENTDVHPLAQLSALGKGMMDATVRNAAFAAVLGGADTLGFKLDQFTEGAADTAKGFFTAMTFTSMGIAVVLYYVLPFLPFVYFFFAVSGWLKSIFEAIVAMPLWALAHIRIDGEGLPGPGASNGYFLLLEIFLRPILIVFGLMASIAIFSALVNVLNQIFDLVVSNVGGYDHELEAGGPAVTKVTFSRQPLDEFFFTAMYAIICYLMGLASFKLVDLIPNNILRWMGVSVATFQENAGDPAGQLSSSVYKGSLLTSRQLNTAISGQRTPGGDLPVILQ